MGQKAVPSLKNAAVDAFKKLTLQVGAAHGRARGRGAAAAQSQNHSTGAALSSHGTVQLPTARQGSSPAVAYAC